ncbi:hypothetical protein B0T19DRAFT_460133 [Cercophora scortea]|uniref:Uncharacterized protein n=1 Tax=Cercophora scortea TaxID=314031 RepID=A0AAE0ILP7_9PEZI|nr:hypothetical protein B0T19DRAFT_460133 [Cercophora scortea]
MAVVCRSNGDHLKSPPNQHRTHDNTNEAQRKIGIENYDSQAEEEVSSPCIGRATKGKERAKVENDEDTEEDVNTYESITVGGHGGESTEEDVNEDPNDYDEDESEQEIEEEEDIPDTDSDQYNPQAGKNTTTARGPSPTGPENDPRVAELLQALQDARSRTGINNNSLAPVWLEEENELLMYLRDRWPKLSYSEMIKAPSFAN